MRVERDFSRVTMIKLQTCDNPGKNLKGEIFRVTLQGEFRVKDKGESRNMIKLETSKNT